MKSYSNPEGETPSSDGRFVGLSPKYRVSVYRAILLSATITVVIFQIVFVVQTWLPFPFWDHLIFVLGYSQVDGGWDLLSYLVAPHNEHVLLLPKILMAIDFEVFDGSLVVLLASSALSWAATVTLLIIRLPREGPRVVTLLCAFTVILFSFSWGLELFFWSFLVQHYLGLFLALLSIHCGVRWLRHRSRTMFLLWLALGCLASLTSASGLLVYPVLGIVALANPSHRARSWWFFAAAACSMSAYRVWVGSETSGVLSSLGQPTKIVIFLAYYFGVPFTANTAWISFGRVWGLLLVLASITVLTKVLFTRGTQDETDQFWIGSLMFALASSVLIALGRVYDIENLATSSRYWYFVALAAVSSLVLAARMRSGQAFLVRKYAKLGTICCVSFGVVAHIMIGINWMEWTIERRMAFERARSGVAQDTDWFLLHPDPSVAREAFKVMEASEIYVYRGSRASAETDQIEPFTPTTSNVTRHRSD